LAFGVCIEAFKVCRPVICIDGTFLTDKYKGTILTVVAADSNNQLLPLAIAFVEGENSDSWYWFLERLKNMVAQDVQDVCVIHDRHKGILQAINDLK
jgi:transposase-like protein